MDTRLTDHSAYLPVLTIGGFLGAGKTTLVNRILAGAAGKRIVVFVNDFGAINIDHDLIEVVEEDRIALTNGCVCCSVNEDLVKSISEFARSERRADAIVVEASGVADPVALNRSLETLEAAGIARLETRLYTLDASCYDLLDYDDTESIMSHAALSDIALINKADLVSAEKLAEIRAELSVAAPYTQAITTVRGAFPLELLFGPEVGERVPRESPPAGKRQPPSPHDYVSWSKETGQLLDRTSFDIFARALAQMCWRAKGLLRFAEAPDQVLLFNLVGYRATLEPLRDTQPVKPETLSRLVAIGRQSKVDAAKLETLFQSVLAPG